MPVERARIRVARVFTQRCFYLFLCLLLLIAAAPLLFASTTGRIVGNGLQLLILIAAVAAVGRSAASFLIAMLLAAPALVFQVLALDEGQVEMLPLSWAFGAAFYASTIVYLLAYVLKREVMTQDKLYGGAAAYLLLGVLWTYLYMLAATFQPGAFSSAAKPPLDTMDMLYYSLTVLTSTGFGDIVPVSPVARSLTMLEQIVGVLFVAILIARLAGIYPARLTPRAPPPAE